MGRRRGREGRRRRVLVERRLIERMDRNGTPVRLPGLHGCRAGSLLPTLSVLNLSEGPCRGRVERDKRRGEGRKQEGNRMEEKEDRERRERKGWKEEREEEGIHERVAQFIDLLGRSQLVAVGVSRAKIDNVD